MSELAQGERTSGNEVATPAPALSPQQWLERVKRDATVLAETLREASDAGVSHAIILPQLVLVFRQSFGEIPEGFQVPGMGA